MEKGERRASRPVVVGGPASTRIRHFEINPDALRRCHSISRNVTLSFAVPAGGAWIGLGTLGGESRTTPPAILQPDAGGPKGTPVTSEELERLCSGHRPGDGDR